MTKPSGPSRPLSLLDGRVDLWCGDCLEVLANLPDASIDSCVTDPPYHLTSIVERFGGENSKAPISQSQRRWAKSGANLGGITPDGVPKPDQYGRLSRGFMGKIWDGGDIAFRPEVWAQVWRALKPGGHLLAFGGTRTYHRMACAIEDAGFEIRDMEAWLYGSGFPKSHSVSKAIDKAAGAKRTVVPKVGWEKTNGREYQPGESLPATAEALQWDGWGTALKPALEPICLARKPLSEGTVAANVLKWGTGALNIDGCRVELSGEKNPSIDRRNGAITHLSTRPANETEAEGIMVSRQSPEAYRAPRSGEALGRWPANVLHDGSAEVVDAFPAESSVTGERTDRSKSASVVGTQWLSDNHKSIEHTDSGSAARFFYSSKADADDRLGSKHPTVKPVDLMQYLARLITPPGGTILDPFAGTGTTGEAAWREGFRAVLIERETEYQKDIQRRMKLCLAGPEERRRESIKAGGKTADAGPLFGGKA